MSSFFFSTILISVIGFLFEQVATECKLIIECLAMLFCYWHEKEKIQRYNRIFHLSKISDDRGKTPKIFRRQARIFIFT